MIKDCPLLQETTRVTGVCYRCGQPGHMARDCSSPQGITRTTVTCYHCGQPGHLARDCPFSSGAVLAAGTMPQTGGRASAESSGSRGRGIGGRGRGRGQARVYALTRQDAQASNAVITGSISVCSFKAYVLFDPGSTYSYVSVSFSTQFDR